MEISTLCVYKTHANNCNVQMNYDLSVYISKSPRGNVILKNEENI